MFCDTSFHTARFQLGVELIELIGALLPVQSSYGCGITVLFSIVGFRNMSSDICDVAQ
jgi:hypothetical protein